MDRAMTDETTTEGGAVIPASFIKEQIAYLAEPNPFWDLFPRPPQTPLPFHRRLLVRIRMRRWQLVGWLHDRLFGTAYCNHDGCD